MRISSALVWEFTAAPRASNLAAAAAILPVHATFPSRDTSVWIKEHIQCLYSFYESMYTDSE